MPRSFEIRGIIMSFSFPRKALDISSWLVLCTHMSAQIFLITWRLMDL